MTAEQGETVVGDPERVRREPVVRERHPRGLVERLRSVVLGAGSHDPVHEREGVVEIVRPDPVDGQRPRSVVSTLGSEGRGVSKVSTDGELSLAGSTKR